MPPRVPRPCLSLAFASTILAAILIVAGRSSAQTMDWSQWAMPTPRFSHVAIYDPVRDRMVVTGGRTATDPDFGDNGEVWSLRFDGDPRWQLLSVMGAGSSQAVAVYDPPGNRMVKGGGTCCDGYPLGYTSVMDLTNDTWDFCCSASAPPSGPGSLAVFDEVRRGMLVLSPYGSVHRLDIAAGVWSTISTVGFLPQPPFAMAHDAPRDRLIVRALGAQPGAPPTTWQLTLSGTPTWSQITTAGTPPPLNQGDDLFFDAPRDRILEVGVDGKVWALSMDATPTWTSIAKPPLPTGTHNPQIAHDAARDRLLWFGSGATNDTWALRLADATWYLVDPGSPIPVLMWHSAVAAPQWDALVVFGGMVGRPTSPRSSTWRLPLSGGGRFEQVVTAGPTPPARSGHAAIYDPVRQRMLVFGGFDGAQYFNDIQALTIGPTPTWSPLHTEDSPPSIRQWSHAIYDPVRDRMVVLGGTNGSTVFRELLAVTLSGPPTWIPLAPDAALPTLQYTDLVYDSRRDRLIAIGTGQIDTRAWWMPAGGPYTWTEYGAPLLGRDLREFAAAYDPAGDRVLIHGGYSASNPETFDQLWAMNPVTGQMSYAYIPGGKPRARYDHTLTRDPVRERFVLFGGWEQLPGFSPYSAFAAGTVWFAKDPSTVVGVGPKAGAPGATLAFRRLWLAAPDHIAFELEGLGEGSARVEVFDVAGRRLGTTTLPQGARSGVIRLAEAARPGVVVARARQGFAPAASRRLAVLR